MHKMKNWKEIQSFCWHVKLWLVFAATPVYGYDLAKDNRYNFSHTLPPAISESGKKMTSNFGDSARDGGGGSLKSFSHNSSLTCPRSMFNPKKLLSIVLVTFFNMWQVFAALRNPKRYIIPFWINPLARKLFLGVYSHCCILTKKLSCWIFWIPGNAKRESQVNFIICHGPSFCWYVPKVRNDEAS